MEETPLQILAIDDSPDNLLAVRAVVADALPGARVLTAPDGLTGLAVAQAADPDVVLLDIVMPGMDGFEVCRRMKASEQLRPIPVVFLTALQTGRDSHVRALEVGAEGFLGKPLEPAELTAQIRAMAKIKAAHKLKQMERERLNALVAERTLELERELAERRKVERELRAEVEARRQSEVALRRAEEQVRAIIENTLAGYFRIDTQGRFQTVNRAWLQMHGYDAAEEVLGARYEVTQPPEDVGKAAAVVSRVLAGESIRGGEFRRRRRDGSVACHMYSVHPVREEGKVTGVEGFLIDTTRLREAQAEFEMLFNEMIDAFALHEIILDAEGRPADYRFLAVNPAFEALTGMRAAAVVGRAVSEVFPQVEPFWIETYGRVALTGEPASFEHFNRDLNRYFQVRAFRPAPHRFACVFVDITPRRKAEQALALHEAELQAIYDGAPMMMCVVNEARQVERMNRAMAAFLGRTESVREPFGHILGCVTALSRPEGCGAGPRCVECPLRLAIVDTLRNGVAHRQIECPMSLLTEGTRREIFVSASTAMVRLEGQARVLICLEDISAHKRLEEQFLQAQKMEAVGQLAGGVAHDFNNILAATMMHLSLLQSDPRLLPETRDSLRELERETKRAANLTRQLLLFSRRQILQAKVFDLNEVLDNLLKMLRRLLGEHIDLTFRGGAIPLWVEADPGMVEQVAMNLCVNARDAMPGGGRLVLSARRERLEDVPTPRRPEARPGEFVCLSVVDSGCGMDEATLKRIYEPFFTTKPVGKGTGLGLATVYGIVKQHQGWIEVESAPGQGTTFRVHLPYSDKAPLAASVAEAKEPVARGAEAVLLVEDEPILRKTIAAFLRKQGYTVWEAANGVEALRHWQQQSPRIDLLLTDMVMPEGMTGLELAAQLRLEKPALPVIVSSGYSVDLLGQRGKTAEGLVYLPKPCAPEVLARALRDCLVASRVPAADRA